MMNRSRSFFFFQWLMYFVSCILFAQVQAADTSTGLSKSSGPPAFFLQDLHDGLCLAGGTYKRCGIDTLWYVTGKPGTYQIHKRLVEETDDEVCLDRKDCHLEDSEMTLANCNHCGTKKWNILGDAETGFALTQDNNKNCLKKEGTNATFIKCDKGFSHVSLQFVTKDDIKAMSSEGAKLINAAAENDEKEVKSLLATVDVNSRDWDQLTPLIAAAGKGHMNMVKLLLENNADPNLSDKDNITAVMEAAIGSHKDVLDLLLSQGAGVDPPAASGVTPMWLAAGEGHVEIVEYLLSKGADPNNQRQDGISALMAASSNGHVEVVDLLLKQDADVNVKDKDGLTALISASENGSVPLVRLLLNAKPEINILSTTGFSPLIISSAHGHLEITKMLVENGAEVDLEHPEAVTALMYAAAGGFPDTVKYLLDNGAQVNARHKQGGSALMEACTAGNYSVVTTLIDAGADAMIIDKDGVTTMMSAASQGHTEVVKLLIDKGVDVNQVAFSGGTAIMFSAGGGHNETTRLLLDNGADVNVIVMATPEYIEEVAKAIAEGKEDTEPHKDGVTALHVAAEGGHIGTVMMLVEAGAVVDIADDEEITPLLNAIKGNYGSVATYLVEHGANPNDVYIDDKKKKHNLLMDSVLVSNTNFTKLLIDKGADINYADDEGVTVITQAAYMGLQEIVEKLLEKGADVTKANKEGIDPLIASASEGHNECLEMILATKQVDVNAKDKDGTNALMAAAVRGHLSTVEILISNGADVNAQNVDGHTALMFAYNGKNQVQTLRDKYREFVKEANDNSTAIMDKALQVHLDTVAALIKNGADLTLKDNEGHQATDFDYRPPEEKEKTKQQVEAASKGEAAKKGEAASKGEL